MKDTDTMDAREFAKVWYEAPYSGSKDIHGANTPYCDLAARLGDILASRDAYRERQALEKAATRHREEAVKRRACENPHHYKEWESAAILGTPRFERGQLVRFKVGRCDLFEWPVKGDETRPNLYEPVLDREGRPVYLPVED